MTSKYDITVMPSTDMLRVCLSCWRRVPTLFSRRIHHTRFPATSALICNGQCGQRWTSMLKYTQRGMSSSSGEEKDTDISSNPFFDKYKQKLKHMQEEDPEQYDARLEEIKSQKEKPVASSEYVPPPPQQPGTSRTDMASGLPQPRSWPPKSLDEVMKVDLVKDLSPDAVTKIWQEHHLSKDCVFSVVPKDDYDELMTKSKLNPMFIFTLPKGDGYEFYLCQFNGKDVYFTPLSMYQLLKENAPPCLSIAHFPELKDDKGIVLMAGEYDDKIISKSEALNLVKQMTLYYGKEAGERYKLLRQFHLHPEQFDHMDIVEQYKLNKEYLENNPY